MINFGCNKAGDAGNAMLGQLVHGPCTALASMMMLRRPKAALKQAVWSHEQSCTPNG